MSDLLSDQNFPLNQTCNFFRSDLVNGPVTEWLHEWLSDYINWPLLWGQESPSPARCWGLSEARHLLHQQGAVGLVRPGNSFTWGLSVLGDTWKGGGVSKVGWWWIPGCSQQMGFRIREDNVYKSWRLVMLKKCCDLVIKNELNYFVVCWHCGYYTWSVQSSVQVSEHILGVANSQSSWKKGGGGLQLYEPN